jgi:hypothetical protein
MGGSNKNPEKKKNEKKTLEKNYELLVEILVFKCF